MTFRPILSIVRSAAPVALAVALLAPGAVQATSYVAMTDAALVDQTPVIVEASVLTVTSSPAAGAPATDYVVLVERVLKGNIAGSNVVVRVPGGVGPDGRGLRVWGSPVLEQSDRAILFLNPRRDGTYGVQQLMLGAFRQAEKSGRSVALRDLSEVTQVSADGVNKPEPLRDFGAFADWIERRQQNSSIAPNYNISSNDAGLSSAPRSHTFIKVDGKRTRWFDFDAGGSVRWKFHRDGFNGNGGGKKDFRDAMAVWTDEPTTNINLQWDGTTSLTAGFDTFDDVNVILFDDPFDTASPGSFSCATGGVLASGGPWFDSNNRLTFGSRTYVAILGADIVTNDGASCFYSTSGEARAEVFAHELGHTLGLDHSCGDDSTPVCIPGEARDEALMRASVHDDGRGAVLGSDDIAAIQKLYPGSGAPSGGGSGASGGGSNSSALGMPTKFRSVIVESDNVRLRWKDNAEDEDEYRIQVDSGDGNFRLIGKLPADTFRVDVFGLLPNTTYIFRVRARGASGNSPYSEELVVTTAP